MDTSLERIRAKIADLRIAERELQALEKLSARTPRPAPGRKPIRKPKACEPPEAGDQAEAHQTIGAAITDVFDQQGALSVGEIAAQIKATGRDINNRAVSFSLQGMKKRGLVKKARMASGRCRRRAPS